MSKQRAGSNAPCLLNNRDSQAEPGRPRQPKCVLGAGCSMADVAACQAAVANCEARFRDLEIPSWEALRPTRYQAAGTEAWDPFAALPGFEEAEFRRRRPVESPPDEHREIVKLLDLKMCPKCHREWSGKDPNYDTLTPLLKEDSHETRRAGDWPLFVDHRGQRYRKPFGELLLKAISLCPYCQGKGTANKRDPEAAGGRPPSRPSSKSATVRRV